MTIFFTILFILVLFNVLLFVFSVNGITTKKTKTDYKASENSAINLSSSQLFDSQYKKAV